MLKRRRKRVFSRFQRFSWEQSMVDPSVVTNAWKMKGSNVRRFAHGSNRRKIVFSGLAKPERIVNRDIPKFPPSTILSSPFRDIPVLDLSLFFFRSRPLFNPRCPLEGHLFSFRKILKICQYQGSNLNSQRVKEIFCLIHLLNDKS